MIKYIIASSLAFILIEIYIFKAVKILIKNKWIRRFYISITAIIYLLIIFLLLNFDRQARNPWQANLIMGLILVFVFPKLLTFIFLLIEDAVRLIIYGSKRIKSKGKPHYPDRRKFVSLVGLGAAGIMSYAFLDGIVFGKYRHRVRTVRLRLKNLPNNFKGYKIVQISDVHSGTFQHPEKLQHAIDLINQQNADLVLFTGDMVNSYAEEFQPFIPLFKNIKAKDGKFSVLGNHDYGTYGRFINKEEEANNLPRLIQFQNQAGFTMLRNENVSIEKDGEKIVLLGVENWGIKPFPQFGDLDKTMVGVDNDAVKILMSHDPTHFDYVVKNYPSFIHLTLSGHTHGMQFGVDLKNIKWSPVQYKYRKWMDLYESNGRYLYVNRGFGVIGYSGRVGILPEITVFELS